MDAHGVTSRGMFMKSSGPTSGVVDSRKRRYDTSSLGLTGSRSGGLGTAENGRVSFHDVQVNMVERAQQYSSFSGAQEVTIPMSQEIGVSDSAKDGGASAQGEPYGFNGRQGANKRFCQSTGYINGDALNGRQWEAHTKNAPSFSGVSDPFQTPVVLKTEPVANQITPQELYEARAEGSQRMMENLSLSGADTQELTQTLEESQPTCVLRLVLHPDVDRIITPSQREALKRHGLYKIEMDVRHSRVEFKRDTFAEIFSHKTSEIDTRKLSRRHCVVECVTANGSDAYTVLIHHDSTNGVRLDGTLLVRKKKYPIAHGQKITLLSSVAGAIRLGYLVENPHVAGAEVSNGFAFTQVSSWREHSLGVLFSAPIVGRDIHGKYHPIAELDIRREYSILQESLTDACSYPMRSTDVENNQTVIEFPPRLKVVAKFANTENFRTIVTLGCRALHFSGHGDENNLYFEDGVGLVHPIPHKQLQELFSAGDSATGIRLAFVSACSSAPLAYAFVSCGIPHVIGVRINQKIEDHAAIEFTKAFYLALARGKSVGASFTIAQQAVAKSPNIRGPREVADKFLLLPEDGDHSEVIFPLVKVNVSESRGVERTQPPTFPKLWFNDLPAICQGFCNRAVEVYKICVALMLTQSRITRLVTITGEEGIGKTAVALAVANYVGPRITLDGGAQFFWIRHLVEANEKSMNEPVADRASEMLRCLRVKVHRFLAKHRQQDEHRPGALLFVFDGCDDLLQSNEQRERFRMFLSDLLTSNPELKVLITARSTLTADGAVANTGERVYKLTAFSPKLAAKMLLSIANRPIRLDEMQRATVQSADKLEVVASHPALIATGGVPKRIAELAGRLTVGQLDDIVPADAVGPMEMQQ